MISAKNMLGNTLTYSNGSKEQLVSEWALSYKSPRLKEIHGDIYGQLKLESDINAVLKGVGARVYPMETEKFSVSLGIKQMRDLNTALNMTLTAGAMLDLDPFSIEYAYDRTDVYQSESQHFLSFSTKLGR